MAGLDTVAAHTAAVSDALMPLFNPLSSAGGFLSIEDLTFPFFDIVGKPRTGEDECPTNCLCKRAAPVIDEVGVLPVMVAIFPGSRRKWIRVQE
uniref:Uncharacterized protein n=1 Tax=Rhizophora mucronata TaxID=61149 RepID=A0A2P2IT04_RHIMU